ncbi:hypothetical protein PGIGA_G00144800 [Pangasianodon gigas]|uniref:Uncharacterized protein n=1 Tax=Pangasianodon gigas TaxID=30993 RepID=A0ACC5XLX3_PANGG|nr:hypothetical protein [Pangasianodon gigas]
MVSISIHWTQLVSVPFIFLTELLILSPQTHIHHHQDHKRSYNQQQQHQYNPPRWYTSLLPDVRTWLVFCKTHTEESR